MPDYNGKRRPAQIAKDRKIIGRMYLRGMLQSEIAEKTGLSQPQVSRDLKGLHKEWLRSALVDFNEAKSKELAKIDMLEVTYWQGWLRSLKDAEKSITEKTTNDVEKKANEKETKIINLGHSKARIEHKGQTGDPRFLTGIQWCIEKRCAIIGINAAIKIAPTDPSGQHALTFNVTIEANGNQPDSE